MNSDTVLWQPFGILLAVFGYFFGVGTLWDEWEVMGERNSGGFDLLLVCC
jgi:hypothetical protein